VRASGKTPEQWPAAALSCKKETKRRQQKKKKKKVQARRSCANLPLCVSLHFHDLGPLFVKFVLPAIDADVDNPLEESSSGGERAFKGRRKEIRQPSKNCQLCAKVHRSAKHLGLIFHCGCVKEKFKKGG